VRRYGAAILIVAASALAAETLYRLTGSTRLSMVFLAGVLVTAYLMGSGPAYLTAGLAFLIYNFYLVEPRFTFSMGTAEDIITLAVFLSVAMLTGSLTGRVRDQAAAAQARARTTNTLFEATREFSASSEEARIRERLAHHLARAGRGEAMVRERLSVVSSPEERVPGREILLETAALERSGGPTASCSAQEGHWTMRPLRDGDAQLGVAAWRTLDDVRLSEDEQTLLDILADVGAAALARARLAAGKAEAEARAKTEDLRNSLLSSISHDLRTPLAAILASATSLQEFGDEFSPEVRRDLAATIQEETVRLDAFVANLLNMTRLQSGAVAIQRIPFSVAEAVQTTVTQHADRARRSVATSIARGLPAGLGDPSLFEQALGNVVQNALRYSSARDRVIVTAAAADDLIVVTVEDEGPGVPEHDVERIFQKFYRSDTGREVSGTGLGLSIARGLMEGMGGTVTAANRASDRGLLVTLTLGKAEA